MTDKDEKMKRFSNRKKVKKRAASPSSVEEYKARISSHRRKIFLRVLGVVALAAVMVFSVKTWYDYRTYDSYAVLAKSTDINTAGASYMALGDGIFRYSVNGASLIRTDETVAWDKTFEMQNAEADACQNTIVVYEKKGMTMQIFSGEGYLSTITTEKPITRARVAGQGVVAAILDDKETTWINFYSSDGSMISTMKTRVDDPGYPVDLAVSPDGRLIMVSYLFVNGEEPTSYVAFYNFGDEGKYEINKIVSGYNYERIIVPQVDFLSDETALAFRDDGFVLYKGADAPGENKLVEVDKEIVSTFYDEDYVGIVHQTSDGEKQYQMTVYTSQGVKKFSAEFDIQYNKIVISDGQVLLYNDSQLCVYNMDGVEKYNGNLDEGKITDVFKIGTNRYLLILDSGLKTIKFNH